MDEIIEKIPQLENRIYVIGGPREQALKEAMTLIAGLVKKHLLTAEFFCLKDSAEEIKIRYEEIAAAPSSERWNRAYFRTQKNGDVSVINGKIGASNGRRFVRLTFIDSLEAMHLKGKEFNREEVLGKLTSINPVIIISDELAATGSDGGQYESDGVTLSLTIM